jgi:hypothetical protein
MTADSLLEGLREAICSQVPFAQLVATLREYRDRGVTRDEAYAALESLRESAPDEATEDGILELMDIVSGWCSRASDVWAD